MIPVPPKSLREALAHVYRGNRLCVTTYARVIVIDKKCVDKFTKACQAVLREDGDGYRLAQGRGSVYLLPGQLKMID